MSQFEPNRSTCSKQFERAVRRRDRSKEGTTEHAEAQKEAARCYDRMYSVGYFRDSYNPSNLLWQFGLSWWNDFPKFANKQHRLTPSKARKLLAALKEREPQFQANLSDLRKRERQYFEEKYAEFQAFLNEAIRLNESIECSY